MIMRFFSVLAVACLAPVWAAGAQDFKFATPTPALAMPAGAARTLPIALTRIAGNIPAGTAWAELSAGSVPWPCKPKELVKWEEADNTLPTETFARVFRDEIKAAGFATSGDPNNLFESDTAKPEYQLGALITNIKLRHCYREALPFKEFWDTSLVMSVEWQFYSVTQARVIARLTSSGGFETKTKDPSFVEVLSGGFADNVRRLTNDEQFRRLVTSGAPASAAPAAAAAPISVTFASAAQPVPLNIAVKSVVTIFAGEGMGSGVLISSDGYILTNHHVAGSNGRVRVRWPDGEDTVGEVIRGDPRRDVALVKTAARGAPLGIRPAPAQLGETVFAVGTPLDKQFATTLTRGIVSATRLIEGLPVIQSDVAIDHGNSGGPLLDEKGQILALTVSRVEPDGVGHDINFFIPIAEALKALDLQPAR